MTSRELATLIWIREKLAPMNATEARVTPTGTRILFSAVPIYYTLEQLGDRLTAPDDLEALRDRLNDPPSKPAVKLASEIRDVLRIEWANILKTLGGYD